MTILIVGGDYIASFIQVFATQHAMPVEHWDGRKRKFNSRVFSNEIRIVIVICDYISHSLAYSIKKKAKQRSIPLIFCRRSVNELKHKLRNMYETSEKYCCDFTDSEQTQLLKSS